MSDEKVIPEEMKLVEQTIKLSIRACDAALMELQKEVFHNHVDMYLFISRPEHQGCMLFMANQGVTRTQDIDFKDLLKRIEHTADRAVRGDSGVTFSGGKVTK